jgi:hypothetical protein
MISYNKIHIYLIGIVLLGSLNSSLTYFNFSLVEYIDKYTYDLFYIHINKIVYIIFALAAIILASQRNTWLPFLGQAVVPSGLFTKTQPANANHIVYVQEKPNTKIIYWSAYPKSNNKLPNEAYGDYANCGYTVTDKDGNAAFTIIEGSGYKLESGKVLEKHIHYRIVHDGMLGPIKTIYY